MEQLSDTELEAAIRYNAGRDLDDPTVRRLQRTVGVQVDGKLGRGTTLALAKWQAKQQLPVSGQLDDATLEELDHEWVAEENVSEDASSDAAVEPPTPTWLIDYRGRERKKDRGKPRGSRPWTQVTGITLHQTAVDFGSPQHPRIIDVPAHAMTFQGGEAVLLNSPTLIVWHGNAFNGGDIGIEVSCRAAGIEGVYTQRAGAPGANTYWRPKTKPTQVPLEATDQQIEATRKLVRYYVQLVAQNHGKINFVHAHRQCAQKPSDPGSRIWQEVGLWAQREFGLTSGPPGWKLGQGSPIPTAWDPRSQGIPYSSTVRGW